MSSLGKTIHILRQAKELSSGELANRAKISPAMLSLIESGKKEASIATLERIASALSVSLDLLIIMSKPRGSKLNTSDRRSNELAGSLSKIIEAEESLKRFLSES